MFSFDLVDMDKLETEFRRQLNEANSFTLKEPVLNDFSNRLKSRRSIAAMSDDVINKNKSLKARLSAVRMLRNNAYHSKVDGFLKVLKDSTEETGLRVALAEAVGWFTLSHKRGEIVSACKEIEAMPGVDPLLLNEVVKTRGRIEVYMR